MNNTSQIKYIYNIKNFRGIFMIFKAIVVPTPKRIKRYLEGALIEVREKSISKEETSEELKHINLSKDSFKHYGITMKIF